MEKKLKKFTQSKGAVNLEEWLGCNNHRDRNGHCWPNKSGDPILLRDAVYSILIWESEWHSVKKWAFWFCRREESCVVVFFSPDWERATQCTNELWALTPSTDVNWNVFRIKVSSCSFCCVCSPQMFPECQRPISRNTILLQTIPGTQWV